MSVGYGYACGVTARGEVFCWGRNEDGQLGNGSYFNSLIPVLALVLELVLEEIKVLESKGLAGLETANISTLRHEIDVKQEELLKRLVRGGSIPEVLRRAWDGPTSYRVP